MHNAVCIIITNVERALLCRSETIVHAFNFFLKRYFIVAVSLAATRACPKCFIIKYVYCFRLVILISYFYICKTSKLLRYNYSSICRTLTHNIISIFFSLTYFTLHQSKNCILIHVYLKPYIICCLHWSSEPGNAKKHGH